MSRRARSSPKQIIENRPQYQGCLNEHDRRDSYYQQRY